MVAEMMSSLSVALYVQLFSCCATALVLAACTGTGQGVQGAGMQFQ